MALAFPRALATLVTPVAGRSPSPAYARPLLPHRRHLLGASRSVKHLIEEGTPGLDRRRNGGLDGYLNYRGGVPPVWWTPEGYGTLWSRERSSPAMATTTATVVGVITPGVAQSASAAPVTSATMVAPRAVKAVYRCRW